jgi:hypothetical protein
VIGWQYLEAKQIRYESAARLHETRDASVRQNQCCRKHEYQNSNHTRQESVSHKTIPW